MEIKDILSKEEIDRYNEEWNSFSNKSKLEIPYNVHSDLPSISKPFQFEDKPIFRARIFQNRLRKFDPYFISKKYIHPFWHAQHYFMVLEQMYHASSNLIRDNSKLIAKDVPEKFDLKLPIFWGDKNTSIELIFEDRGQRGKYLVERGHSRFYDKTNQITSRISVLTYWQPRAYIRDLERIRKGDQRVVQNLIRKIEMQDINHKRLINPRQNLQTTKDHLISELEKGNIPEEELHDFFSLWDNPKSLN